MKKTVFNTLVAVSMAATTYAQLPNPGFENWTSMGSYENPDGWATLNDYTNPAGVYTATKGTPGSPGSAFLKLTSKTAGPAVVNGIAVSGTFDPTTQQATSGFAFNQQPASFDGKWQHMIYGSSQGSINVTLTRWDSGSNSRVIVANANKTLTGMAMSWANFSIPFVYLDNQAPDSCIIVMKASGNAPTPNDYLWVDNLSFNGNVAGIEETASQSAISVYPNPASDQATISVLSPSEKQLQVFIHSLSGALIVSQSVSVHSGQNTIPLDLAKLAPGNYLISIENGENTSVVSFTVR